jgi:hypothetical protein
MRSVRTTDDVKQYNTWNGKGLFFSRHYPLNPSTSDIDMFAYIDVV